MTRIFAPPLAAALAAGLLAAPAWAQGIPQDYWELDGNITSNDGGVGPDWEEVFNGGVGDLHPDCTFVQSTILIKDPAPQTIFTKGGSKDTNDVPNWNHKDGSVPDKNNTTHGGAVALNCAGELYLFAFGLRFDNDGDSNNGIWLFQDDVAPIMTGPDAGKFSGEHFDNDPLLVAGFSNGGAKANLGLFLWDDVSNKLITDIDPASNQANCATSTTDLCGIANPGGAIAVPAMWGYTDKDGISNSAAANAFWEVGANLTSLIGEVCATGFLTNTRSSTSPTAQLKDFLFGDFNVCGIDVTIQCDFDRDEFGQPINDGLNDAGTAWKYLVKGTGSSQFVPADNYEVEFSSVPAIGGDPVHAFGPVTIPGNVDTPWPGPTADHAIVYETTVNGPKLKASATAESFGGTALGAEAEVDCPTGASDPMLAAAKDCIACLDIQSEKVVVEVNSAWKICNTGNVVLENVSVTDDAVPGFEETFATLAVGACELGVIPSYLPSSVDDGYADNAAFSNGLTVVYDVGLGGPVGVVNTDGSATCELCFDDSGAPFTGDTGVPLSCPDPSL